MTVSVVAISLVAVAGSLLLAERDSWPAVLRRWPALATIVGLGALCAQALSSGLSLADVYCAAALGGLAAAGRDGPSRRVLGTSLLLLGGCLLAAVTTSPPTAALLVAGPSFLAIVTALSAGALATLAIRRLCASSEIVVGLTVAALLMAVCVQTTADLPGPWWGIAVGLRTGGEQLWRLAWEGDQMLLAPLVLERGRAGLLVLSAAIATAVGLVLNRRGRRWSRRVAALLALAAMIELIATGLGASLQAGDLDALSRWHTAGELYPTPVAVQVDLSSALHGLAVIGVAIALIVAAGPRTAADPTATTAAAQSELDLAVLVGCLLTAGLLGVWRELLGTELGAGVGPLWLFLGLALVGIRLLGVRASLVGASTAGIVLIVGALHLPAGVVG